MKITNNKIKSGKSSLFFFLFYSSSVEKCLKVQRFLLKIINISFHFFKESFSLMSFLKLKITFSHSHPLNVAKPPSALHYSLSFFFRLDCKHLIKASNAKDRTKHSFFLLFLLPFSASCDEIFSTINIIGINISHISSFFLCLLCVYM